MSPLIPTNSQTNIKVCIANPMRIFRLIPRTSIQRPTSTKWAQAVKTYLENLPRNTVHVAL